MKKLLSLFSLILAIVSISVSYASGWKIDFSETSHKSFVENKGQFEGRNKLSGTQVLFAYDNQSQQILFTKEGVTYRFDKWNKNPDRKKGDRTKPKYVINTDVVHVLWGNANPDMVVYGEEEVKDYSVYSIKGQDNSFYTTDNLKGYKKIVYQNVYPLIDAVYEFHPQSGIKYSLIVHPGGDVSRIKMNYAQNAQVQLDEQGMLNIPTAFGNIVEHAPVTFYAGNNKNIASEFVLNGTHISFRLGNYDATQTIVIDPWVETPTLQNSNMVWECEVDGAGNVYAIGGDMPMRLQKYSAVGDLLWTYNTPWDTVTNWLGTIATDYDGNSYITSGSTAAIQKINTNGNLIWTRIGNNDDEYWSIAFSCDQSIIGIGGARISQLSPVSLSKGAVFGIDVANGQLVDSAFVASNRLSFPNDINEVRSITSLSNNKYYYLTLDSICAINQNLSACSGKPLFEENTSYSFAYKSEYFRPNNGNSGICAIKANDNFVYTQNGVVVEKRSLVNGRVITSATIPGGITTSNTNFSPHRNQPGNSGIAIDDCGSVYVGSADRVLKYDADLNIIDSVLLPFGVYDIAINNNGEIIVAGGTGNSNSVPRTGYLQAINMSACLPFTFTTCCDATICAANDFLENSPPVNLTAAHTQGGVWSGTGITDVNSGTFDASIAGIGTHAIVYTVSCGSDTLYITVKPLIEVCITENGELSVNNNGAQTYQWQRADSVINCTACFNGMCGVPQGCEQTVIQWVTFDTTNTIAVPTVFPIKIVDANNNELLITDTVGLPTCPATTAIVWPGDADDNLVANVYDVFPILIGHGTTGYARDSVSTLWIGHLCELWSQTIYNGINLAHADCNGDGVVNGDDFQAIFHNYGLTHVRSNGDNSRAGEPMLTLVPDKNIYLPGDTVTIDVVAGDANLPLDEIYGIAFELLFDKDVVVNETFQINFPNSFLGNISNNLYLSKVFETNGKADGAVGRKDQQNINGHGKIAELQFVAKNMLGVPVNSAVSVADYLAINALGDTVFFDLSNSEASFVVDIATGLFSSGYYNGLKIYPNPFNESTTIEYSLNTTTEVSLKVYDLLGKTIFSNTAAIKEKGIYKEHFVNNNNASKGVLFVELTINGERITKKIVQLD